MLSAVEAWWAGLCTLPFDGAQGDTPLGITYSLTGKYQALFLYSAKYREAAINADHGTGYKCRSIAQ